MYKFHFEEKNTDDNMDLYKAYYSLNVSQSCADTFLIEATKCWNIV